MQFFDSVQITVSSGKGGDGVIAGRREKYEPFGGPAGGDGGSGGSVFFEATNNERTLMPYRHRKHYDAKGGEPGQSKDMYGKGAEDLILPIPVGTLIKDAETKAVLAHFTENGQRYLLARGGRGGSGNMHFSTSTNQYPHIALLGEPGETKELLLELQLLADVALIGTPSVGKSSLINVLARTRVKTAPYPFTTIVPHVGMVSHKGRSRTVIDIPGLIEGASSGKGLGNIFLRHILKARCFMLMLDMSKEQNGMQEIGLLLEEIRSYIDQQFIDQPRQAEQITALDQRLEIVEARVRYTVYAITESGARHVLLRKAVLFVINKTDLYGQDTNHELWKEYLGLLHTTLKDVFKQWHATYDPSIVQESILPISAMARTGIETLLDTTIHMLDAPLICTYSTFQPIALAQTPPPSVTQMPASAVANLVEKGYISEQDLRYLAVREVVHPEIAYLTYVLPWGNAEAEARFRGALEKKKILNWLKKFGARKGDVLAIQSPYTGHDNKYILRD